MSGKEKASLVDQAGRNSLDPKFAPIGLPAGSFDIEELAKQLDKVVDAPQEKRNETVADALRAAAAEGTVIDQADRDIAPGFKAVEVENKDLGIVERTTVFDEKLAEQIAAGKTEQAEINAETAAALDARAGGTTNAGKPAVTKGE